MGDLAGLIAVFGIFGWIPIMVYYKHKIHLEQIRMQGGGPGAPGTRQMIEELRGEVRQLRDQSSKFDVSFDAALCRIEDRVDRLESERYASGQQQRAASTLVGGGVARG
jgi:hypothetical protein